MLFKYTGTLVAIYTQSILLEANPGSQGRKAELNLTSILYSHILGFSRILRINYTVTSIFI